MDVETTLRRAVGPQGSQVEFVVSTASPIYQRSLVKMGWRPADEAGSFIRRLDEAPDVDAIFQRFSSHVETMVRQSARLDPIDWTTGLEEFVSSAERGGLRWWLYGTGALAVRGVPVEPGDLDIHVDDAFLAGRLLADQLVEPVTRMRGWVADSGGRAFVGVIVEWLAGAHPTGLHPPHEQEEAVVSDLELVPWRGLEIPVPPLEVQLAVAERRGQAQRAALIREALRH